MAELLGINESWQALDIACGRGTTASFLFQEYGCHVVGMDLSRKLISMAQDKADFVIGDAGSLPFVDSAFDAVISECSFSLLPDKEGAASEIERVLRAGGKLAITDVFLREEVPQRLRSHAAFAACIAGAMKLEEYIRLFKEVGFRAPYVEDHSNELKKAAWQIITAYGTMESFLANWGGSYAEDWKLMFKQGKPGYALIAFTKP
jgi:ubiquinone/menaquinone biosynthesis C-methylase UbiE